MELEVTCVTLLILYIVIVCLQATVQVTRIATTPAAVTKEIPVTVTTRKLSTPGAVTTTEAVVAVTTPVAESVTTTEAVTTPSAPEAVKVTTPVAAQVPALRTRIRRVAANDIPQPPDRYDPADDPSQTPVAASVTVTTPVAATGSRSRNRRVTAPADGPFRAITATANPSNTISQTEEQERRGRALAARVTDVERNPSNSIHDTTVPAYSHFIAHTANPSVTIPQRTPSPPLPSRFPTIPQRTEPERRSVQVPQVQPALDINVDWVEYFTGQKESVWTAKVLEDGHNDAWEVGGKGQLLIKNCVTNDLFNAGILHYKSIGELKILVSGNMVNTENNPVRIYSGTNDANISSILNDKDNAGHMFQAASQFDGLECTDEDTPSKKSDFLNRYLSDPTQGPMVSLAAGAAAIARRDHPYTTPNPSQIVNSQGVNYLSELGDIFKVRNGYIVNNTSSTSMPEGDLEPLLNRVKVMFNQDATVYFNARLYDRITVELTELSEEERLNVHQVFTAAMNVKQPPNGANNRANDSEKGISAKLSFLLEAAYTSAYLSAHVCRAPVLWLTLVGGGVFGNPFNLIVAAIRKVHAKYGGGLEVRLCDYGEVIKVRDETFQDK